MLYPDLEKLLLARLQYRAATTKALLIDYRRLEAASESQSHQHPY